MSQQTTPSKRRKDKKEFVCGIDEAGRGPVIGPMVYSALFCEKSFEARLKDLFKVADSKTLTDQTRQQIFAQFQKYKQDVSYFVRIVEAPEISNKMLQREKYNLNLISHDCAIELIKQVNQAVSKEPYNGTLSEVYIDTVGDPSKYQAKLEELFPDISITVSKKADSLFPVVSASSIVAKVTRDERVDQIAKEIQCKVGSGYPSDPNTKKYLDSQFDNVFGFAHSMMRFSWKTIDNLLEANKCAVIEWSDEEDELEDQQNDSDEETAKGKRKKKSSTPKANQSQLSQFHFQVSSSKPDHEFFNKRGIKRVKHF